MGGKLQALQVIGRSGNPIMFHAGQADADISRQDVRDLHTYHLAFRTNWVTSDVTSKDGFSPFDADKAAKATGVTPFCGSHVRFSGALSLNDLLGYLELKRAESSV
jgi:hypothetical protein